MIETKFLNMKMLCDYIHLAKSTIYKKVQNNTIPYIKLGSRTLFDKEQIDDWLRNGGSLSTDLPELPKI